MSIYNLKLELRKDRPDRYGKCIIRIRAILNGKSKYVSTDIKVTPDEWLDEAQAIKINVPNSVRLNYKLQQLKNLYEKEILDVERITGDISESKVEKVFAGRDIFDFHHYAIQYFDTFQHKYDKDTLRSYMSDLEKFKSFRPVLSVHEVTGDLIARYHKFMRTERGNSENTCHKALKPLKKVIRYALNVEKLIKDDPFKVYNISKVQTMPTYLTMEELEQIWDVCVNKTMYLKEGLRLVGLYFLLSCYTGLRYSDLSQLHSSGVIKNGRVFLVMVKGQEPLSLPLLKRASILIELIGKNPIISNSKGNQYLKILQVPCNIVKPLHWHVGRHTMAMMMADLGFDKDITAVMLGHKSIRSTAVYHRISNARGNAEVDRLQKKLDEIGHS